MSSLAAARADNFYHPPDWDPRRQSRAEASGAVGWKAHPLRERAKKLASEGVLVIRFEMPFDVRCSHCGNRIAKGVRFDVLRDRADPNVFWFYEVYANDDTAVAAHRSSAHYKAWVTFKSKYGVVQQDVYKLDAVDWTAAPRSKL